MMLRKGKTTAFIMACIFLLSGMTTRMVCEMVFGYEAGLYGLMLKYQEEGSIIVMLIIAGPILLIAAGILALFISGRNDKHFGKKGALRWSMAGVTYGILKVGEDLLVSAIGWTGMGKLAEDLFGFLAIVVSYHLVFQVLSNTKRRFGRSKVH
jgi:hypothetical protein